MTERSKLCRARELLYLMELARKQNRFLYIELDKEDGRKSRRCVLNVTVDAKGSNGGDPGDVIVSLSGSSRAYNPYHMMKAWTATPGTSPPPEITDRYGRRA